jgi:phosphoglycerate dehydrogenase-like enzyme
MARVILLGKTACLNAGRLSHLVKSPEWELVELPDEDDEAALRRELPGARALIGLRWRSDWRELAGDLKLVQALGAGVDAYEEKGLPFGCALCNVYEHGVPVAEYVVGMMVALTVRLTLADGGLRQGAWVGSGRLDGQTHGELAGRSVGLIGWGSIGREVARRLRAFDMRIRAVRANPRVDEPGDVDWIGGPERLDELLGVSDYVVVCCPLTESTRGMLDRARLARFRRGAFLINVARAEIVDELALYEALRERRLAGAALDVWYRYPVDAGLDPDQRMLPATLPFGELDNVIMTPHLSAWTEEMVERRWQKIAANLDALAEGRPLTNLVCLAD